MILLTGATGFLGSYLLTELVAAGHPVRAIRHHRKMPFYLAPEIGEKTQWMDGDLMDVVSLAELVSGCTTIIHSAGLVSFDPADRHRLFDINVEGTANLVNAALENDVPEFIYVSSVAALGNAEPGHLVSEASPWEPGNGRSPYGTSKYYAEREVWRGMGEGLSTLIVNPSTLIGFGDWNETSNRLFRNAWENFPWYTEGENGFVDVRDVARAIIALWQSGRRDERFIISAENWSYRRLLGRISTGLGKSPPLRHAGRFVSGMAWRLEKWKNILGGRKPLLTRETAAIAQKKTGYDNRKLLAAVPAFSFTPLTGAIETACTAYRLSAEAKNPA